jgi:hypothetical protein
MYLMSKVELICGESCKKRSQSNCRPSSRIATDFSAIKPETATLKQTRDSLQALSSFPQPSAASPQQFTRSEVTVTPNGREHWGLTEPEREATRRHFQLRCLAQSQHREDGEASALFTAGGRRTSLAFFSFLGTPTWLLSSPIVQPAKLKTKLLSERSLIDLIRTRVAIVPFVSARKRKAL